MQSVAQSWLVLELTNSPFRLGLVSALQFAPMLVLAFFAGALAARIVGPALAGLAIARWGTAVAFYLNAASFVPVIVALFAVGAQGRPRAASGRSMAHDIREGVRFAVSTPRVALTMAMVLAVSG